MPKDNPSGYKDLFGEFLMKSYLSGNMPGGQLNNFNTVLDMLSPGAVASRQEAGVPNVAEQLANMFGGTNMAPEQIEQMQEQAGGLAMTAPQQSVEDVAMAEQETNMNMALLELLGLQEQTAAGERVGIAKIGVEQAGVDVQGRLAGVKEAMVPVEKQRIQADLDMKAAQTRYYDHMSKASPQDQLRLNDLNLNSIVQWNKPIDPETGQPDMKAPDVTPAQRESAMQLLKLKQTQPVPWTAINALLGTGNEDFMAIGGALLEQLTGLTTEDVWEWGAPEVVNVRNKPNVEALEARKQQLIKWRGQGMMSTDETDRQLAEIDAEIARLQGQ